MPRYDYRIKSRVFRESDVNRHQDFNRIKKQYASHRRTAKTARFVLILIALVLLIGILVFTARADQQKTSYQLHEMELEGVDQEIN